ncbi:MAG: trigger factor [Bradymonadaceae bacterium]|nr:trigger factor [Lujinxingiaceae bacterium]
MPIEVQETGPLTRLAAVTVPAAEYRREVDKSLKQLAGRVKVKGFRKGHIPLSVMRQRYGDAVTREVIEELVQKYVSDLVKQHDNVLFLGTPQINELPVEDKGALQFNIDLELRPNIDPIGYMGLEVEKPEPAVDSAAIDAQLEQLREQAASLEPVLHRTTILEGDTVVVDFAFVGDNPELENFKGDDAQLEVGSKNALPGINEALIGAEFGAVLEPEITLDDNFPVENLRGQSVAVRLTVKAVKKRVLPEINDDFAKASGQAETLLDLRSKLRKELEAQREHQAMHLAEESLMDRLIAQNDFELPPLFVDSQLEHGARQRVQQMLGQQEVDLEALGLDLTQIKEAIREETIAQIKGEFLLMAIAEKEQLKLDDADMKAYFEHRAAHANVPARQIEGYMRQDRERWRQATALALLEKTRQFLLKEATLKNVAWPSESAELDELGADAPAEVGDEQE